MIPRQAGLLPETHPAGLQEGQGTMQQYRRVGSSEDHNRLAWLLPGHHYRPTNASINLSSPRPNLSRGSVDVSETILPDIW